MTLTTLIEALREEIRCAVEGLKLPREYTRSANAQYKPISIYLQQIPADLFERDDYFPCVVIELIELKDDLKEGSTATVGLSFGVFAKEEDAWKDAFYLMEAVRLRLLNRRNLAQSFRLTGEITWQAAQNQPTPFYFLYAEARYQIYQPQETFAGYYNDSGV